MTSRALHAARMVHMVSERSFRRKDRSIACQAGNRKMKELFRPLNACRNCLQRLVIRRFAGRIIKSVIGGCVHASNPICLPDQH